MISIFPGNVYFMQGRTRYETLSLRGLGDTPNSNAAMNYDFVCVGWGGNFFSPYQGKSTYGKLFNYFFQYLEGSYSIGRSGTSCTAEKEQFDAF
jgi:hypothetical protein